MRALFAFLAALLCLAVPAGARDAGAYRGPNASTPGFEVVPRESTPAPAPIAAPTRGLPFDAEMRVILRGAAVRLASLSTPDYACAFYPPNAEHPATSAHVWNPRAGTLGAPCAIISTNATWAPGEPFLVPKPGGYGQPRSMLVARRIDGAWQVATGPPPEFTRLSDVVTVYGNWRDPGEQGGAGVVLHPPYMPSLDVVDCTAARMPVAAWNTKTGEILTRENALATWFEYRLDRGDGANFRYPHFLREPAPAADSPESALWAVKGHDEYHLSRAFMDALGAWRAYRDPVARALILIYAEDARVAWTRGDVPKTSDYNPFSLKRELAGARANPGHGGRIVRGVAWTLRLLAAALEVGPSNRVEFEATVADIIWYVRLVQMPCGAFYDGRFGFGLDQDEPWLKLGLALNKGECPAWQVPFLVRAVWEAQKVCPGTTRLAKLILRDAEKLWGPRTPRVEGEDGAPPGLPRYLVVSVNGVPVDVVTEGVGPARPYYDADAFACFAEARAVRAASVQRTPRRRRRVLAFAPRRIAA